MRGSISPCKCQGSAIVQLNSYPILTSIFNVLNLQIVLMSAPQSQSTGAEVRTSLAENFIRFSFCPVLIAIIFFVALPGCALSQWELALLMASVGSCSRGLTSESRHSLIIRGNFHPQVLEVWIEFFFKTSSSKILKGQASSFFKGQKVCLDILFQETRVIYGLKREK